MKTGLFLNIGTTENKHFRYAVFFTALAILILLVTLTATLLTVVMVVVVWMLSQIGSPCGLLCPEISLLDQLAMLDYKSAAIFTAIPFLICLALAAAEYLEYRYKEIEKL